MIIPVNLYYPQICARMCLKDQPARVVHQLFLPNWLLVSLCYFTFYTSITWSYVCYVRFITANNFMSGYLWLAWRLPYWYFYDMMEQPPVTTFIQTISIGDLWRTANNLNYYLFQNIKQESSKWMFIHIQMNDWNWDICTLKRCIDAAKWQTEQVLCTYTVVWVLHS